MLQDVVAPKAIKMWEMRHIERPELTSLLSGGNREGIKDLI